jgi:hypothetical protein
VHLQVYVTERPTDCRQQIANRPSRSRSISELNLIVERAVRAWWHVEESLRAGNGFARELTLVRRQHLPDPPDTIDHGVVKVERRVARAGEYIVAGIAAESVVAAAVDADLEGGVSIVCLRLVLSSSRYLHRRYRVHLACSSGSRRRP